METFAVGDVVLVKFPFSDFSEAKLRPALIVAKGEYDDFILCQITSKNYDLRQFVKIKNDDFKEGSLGLESYVRIKKIFTASEQIFVRKIAQVKLKKRAEILFSLRKLFDIKAIL